MRLLLCFTQKMLGASGDHFNTMIDIALDDLFETHRARLTIHQRDVDDRESLLQWGALVQLILDNRRISALLEFDHNPRLRIAT